MDNTQTNPVFPSNDGLSQFRQLISHHEKGVSPEPYSTKKSRVLTYRIIFALIGLFFISLLYFTLYGTPHALILQYLHNSRWVGLIVTTLSAVLGSISLFFSWSLRAETDVMQDFLHTAKKKLSRIYAMKKAGISPRKFLPYTPCYHNTVKLKNTYHSRLERIEAHQEELSLILRKINESSILSSAMKEVLFNQALVEFRDKLEEVIAEYEESQMVVA